MFDFEAWHNHRSRKRYLEHCITLFRSYFFRDLLGPLAVLVGTAVAVGCYEQALQVREAGGGGRLFGRPFGRPFERLTVDVRPLECTVRDRQQRRLYQGKQAVGVCM